MFRTVLSLIVLALFIAVNVNAQYHYQPYEYKPYQYQAPTYEYKPYQYKAPTYEYKPYQYQAPTYEYNFSEIQQQMDYNRKCNSVSVLGIGYYGCDMNTPAGRAVSEATIRYKQEQYIKAQMAAQATLRMQERAREKFYNHQANMIQFIQQ